MQFVPMIWGNNGTFDFYDTVKGLMDSGMDIEYVSLSLTPFGLPFLSSSARLSRLKHAC